MSSPDRSPYSRPATAPRSSGRRALRWPVPATLALLVGSAGCAGNQSESTHVSCSALTVSSARRPSPWRGTVFTIVMENHSRDQIIGNTAEAPFINALARQGATARNYRSAYVSPSKPNYFWLVAGQNFGILDNDDPSPEKSIDSTGHIADQIEAAGLTWKTYQQSMGEPCGLVSKGEYAAKHNPFIYFSNINGSDGTAFQPSPRCREHVVDYSELEKDLAAGTLPDYVFITPDLINDMHDGSTRDGDSWLAREVPKILASAAFQQGGVLFLVWDEGGGYPTADDPPFVVLSPSARQGFVSERSYTASSYLKTVQLLLGLDVLPCGADRAAPVEAMDDLFTVPLGAP